MLHNSDMNLHQFGSRTVARAVAHGSHKASGHRKNAGRALDHKGLHTGTRARLSSSLDAQFPNPSDLPSRSAGDATRRTGSRLRVLVVDDNEDAVVLLGRLLRLRGHDARCCTSGAEALTAGAEFKPDVVILDLGMPGLNGFETAERLKQEPWGSTVQLIALTGWGQPDDVRRTLAAGFHTHFVKPLAIDRLLNLLEKL